MQLPKTKTKQTKDHLVKIQKSNETNNKSHTHTHTERETVTHMTKSVTKCSCLIRRYKRPVLLTVSEINTDLNRNEKENQKQIEIFDNNVFMLA